MSDFLNNKCFLKGIGSNLSFLDIAQLHSQHCIVFFCIFVKKVLLEKLKFLKDLPSYHKKTKEELFNAEPIYFFIFYKM